MTTILVPSPKEQQSRGWMMPGEHGRMALPGLECGGDTGRDWYQH